MHTIKAAQRATQSTKTAGQAPRTRKPRAQAGRALAARLKAARLDAGMTQADVGRLFTPPIARAAVAQWEDPENGTTPQLERVAVLARAYGTTPDRLLTGTDTDPAAKPGQPLTAEAIEMAFVWMRLPANRRRAIKENLFILAAALRNMPWLGQGKPLPDHYSDFEAEMLRLSAERIERSALEQTTKRTAKK